MEFNEECGGDGLH